MAADFSRLATCWLLRFGARTKLRELRISGSGSPWNFRIDVLPYDHKNVLDGTPALLYYYLYAHVKEAEKMFFGNVSIFFIF